MSHRVARAAGSVLVSAATAIAVVNLAVLPFLTTGWIQFAQDRADAAAWTGYSRERVRVATDSIVADLLNPNGQFDVVIDGQPVLSDAERSHMRDVRFVFGAAAGVAGIAWLALVVGGLVAGRAGWFGRAVRIGGLALMAGLAVVAGVGLVAFDAAFAAFHRIFFAGGNWAFDPGTDRLVQLFPTRFWFETSLAVGAVAFVLATAVVWGGNRRLRANGPVATAPPSWEAAR